MKKNRTSNAKVLTGLLAMLLPVIVMPGACGGGGVRSAVKDTMEIVYRMPVTTEDEPWKMMNGVYAVGLRYVILDAVTQERMQALSYIAGGGVPGLAHEDGEGGYFSAEADDGVEGRRYRDEFLAICADAGADASLTFLGSEGQMIGINTFIRRSMRVLDPGELESDDETGENPNGGELGWTLMLMAYSDMLKSSWMNTRGNMVSAGDVLDVAIERPVSWGPYNGLMENYGIAVALREFKKNLLEEEFARYDAADRRNRDINLVEPDMDTLELSGVWGKAQERVNLVADLLKQNRNRQGTFTSTWYAEAGTAEPAEEVLYTGLALDFLSAALPDEELNAPWVRTIAGELAYLIRNNRYQLYEYNDALTKAAHALRSYHNRLTGNEPIRDRDVQIEQEKEEYSPCCS